MPKFKYPAKSSLGKLQRAVYSSKRSRKKKHPPMFSSKTGKVSKNWLNSF